MLGEQVYLRDDIPCRYVEGGMGSVSLAISKAAKEAGAHVVTSAEVYSFCTHFSSFHNATSSLWSKKVWFYGKYLL